MKKSLVYGTIAMALIAALAVGIPAAVSANTSDTVSAETSATTTVDEQKPEAEFTARVAEILNLDEATVTAAFQQATQEMMAEKQKERLQTAVDNGLITEEEAAEIQAWMDSRPAALEGMGPLGGPDQSMGRGRMMGQADPYAFCAP